MTRPNQSLDARRVCVQTDDLELPKLSVRSIASRVAPRRWQLPELGAAAPAIEVLAVRRGCARECRHDDDQRRKSRSHPLLNCVRRARNSRRPSAPRVAQSYASQSDKSRTSGSRSRAPTSRLARTTTRVPRDHRAEPCRARRLEVPQRLRDARVEVRFLSMSDTHKKKRRAKERKSAQARRELDQRCRHRARRSRAPEGASENEFGDSHRLPPAATYQSHKREALRTAIVNRSAERSDSNR